MARQRANALRAAIQILEASGDLCEKLQHVLGANSVQSGARIVGNGLKIQDLPIPFLVLDFDSGAPDARDGLNVWDIFVDVFARDVFAMADILDLLEDAVTNNRMNSIPNIAQTINQIKFINHQRLDSNPPDELIVTRVALRITWA